MMNFTTLRSKFRDFFDLTPFLVPQADAEEAIRTGVSFRGINSLILVLAIFIASLGLNQNSTAVIIGAMLISPLMGPIIGIGLAVGIHDFDLMKRAFRNLAVAAAISILTSYVYFLISPVSESHSELLARTSPTIYDVFIALFGGAAGILALGAKNKGNVIPGVAIATALMPPLCTAGFGLATAQWHYFIGALYLFFINSVFIALATFAGVKMMKYKLRDFDNPRRARKVRQTVYIIAGLTMVPAIFMTYNMFALDNFQRNCASFVSREFNFPDTQVLNYKADMQKDGSTLSIALIGAPLPQDSLVAVLTDKLPFYHLAGTRLHIIQGSEMAPGFDSEKAGSSMLSTMYAMTQSTIERQQVQIDSLNTRIAALAANDSAGAAIAPELRVLFPEVERIAVTTAVVCNVDSARSDTLMLALVRYSRPMSPHQTDTFREYLRARLNDPRLTLAPLP